MFTFQQFTIDDSRCAMKVGTDGVLLGAWADLSETTRILDLGCGSGLIALMAAQRNPQALVKGVEIDASAAADAQANVAASPFHERVQITCADALTLSAPSFEADCILSNPPYHEEDLLPPEAQRAAARHTRGGGLTFAALLRTVDLLLSPECPHARFSVILPTPALTRFIPLAAVHGLYVTRRTAVVTKVGKPCKRTLLEFRRQALPGGPVCDTLELMDAESNRSVAYAQLCRDFYLK